jgi:hypothetical protein
MNDELKRIWKISVVEKSKALFWHLSGGGEENHETSQARQPV